MILETSDLETYNDLDTFLIKELHLECLGEFEVEGHPQAIYRVPDTLFGMAVNPHDPQWIEIYALYMNPSVDDYLQKLQDIKPSVYGVDLPQWQVYSQVLKEFQSLIHDTGISTFCQTLEVAKASAKTLVQCFSGPFLHRYQHYEVLASAYEIIGYHLHQIASGDLRLPSVPRPQMSIFET